ncbi:MAG: arginine--tRNA ligase [Candidatus Heimdallarchaeota archaeon]
MSSRIHIEIEEKICSIIKEKHGIEPNLIWSKPPSSELGDLSIPLFNIAKKLDLSPSELGDMLVKEFSFKDLVEKTEFRDGFFNVFFNKNRFVQHTLHNIIDQTKYGQSSEKASERIIIEHTSSNPTGPLHVGNFRGSVLGDVLGRLFRFLGAAVNFRYYINDLGRQIAPLVIGYDLLKEEKAEPDVKVDLWIGKIYAAMNTLLEIHQLKNRLLYFNLEIYPHSSIYELKDEEVNKYLTSIDNSIVDEREKNRLKDWTQRLARVQNSLQEKIPTVYDHLQSLVDSKIEDLDKMTKHYVISYQEGLDKEIVSKFRDVTKKALSGHVETLNMFNIFHEDFDWESDVAWSGEVEKILKELDSRSFLRHDGLARLLLNDKIAFETKFKEKNGIKHEIPDLIIVNSEGITLYPCRDIAYHFNKLDKFNATFCFNVIAKMQQLPQQAVRVALYGLDKSDVADRIAHFDYEYVSLIGRKMAGREFEYVTPDELYELARNEINILLKDRDYSKEEKTEIARKVAASSIKYHILKIDPQKSIAFDVKKAVNLNENTGPFLQYSYARALNILNKAPEKEINVQTIISSAKDTDFFIEKNEEWELVKLMEELPSVYLRAIESIRPDSIAHFAYSVASAFHKFYEMCPVLIEENENIRNTRILIVYSTVKCLESLFEVMGIDTLEKM